MGQWLGLFFQKAYKQDALQWTKDESFCAHLVTNEVRFLQVSEAGMMPSGKCIHKGLSQYRLAPVPGDDGKYAVGVFTPEKVVSRLWLIYIFGSMTREMGLL